MNARDELMADIRAIDGPALLGGDVLADGLLAAGYHKPRTISSRDELDSLPAGSIVLDDNGDAELKVNTPQSWLELRADGALEDSVNLPATVLWEPQP